MTVPTQVTFRNMETSGKVEGWIREAAEKLATFYDRITGCHVVVEVPHRHQRWGSRYHVRVDLIVPGAELIAKREPSLHGRSQERKGSKHLEVKAPHKELRQAIDEAFKEIGRQLQDYARRQRGDVKTHARAPRARVSKLLPAGGYGFLETPGGREIYFHENSVPEAGFDHLKVGAVVRFVEEEGEKGPQASAVTPVRGRRPHKSEEMSMTRTAESTRP